MNKRFLVASLASLALFAAPLAASTHQHYHRTDAERAAAARTYLDAHALGGVSVRAWRGRLTLGGALPSGERLVALERGLAAATGAISVHH